MDNIKHMTIAIYGCGSLGREIIQLVNEINSLNYQYSGIIYVDDTLAKNEKSIEGIRCISFDSVNSQYADNRIKFVVGVGDPRKRQLLYDRIKKSGYELETLIHPSVFLPNSVVLGEGVVINKYSIVSLNVRIGNNSYIQPQSSIGHDVILGDNCVVSTHSTISGHCHIGNNCFIAINVPIKEDLRIGNDCIIGMGSIITKDVPDNMITSGLNIRSVRRPKNAHVFN